MIEFILDDVLYTLMPDKNYPYKVDSHTISMDYVGFRFLRIPARIRKIKLDIKNKYNDILIYKAINVEPILEEDVKIHEELKKLINELEELNVEYTNNLEEIKKYEKEIELIKEEKKLSMAYSPQNNN